MFTDEELDKMAEYSANLYAKSDEEKKSFVEYYRKYYSDGGDAAPALAALQAKAKSPDLGMVTVNGIEHQKYPSTSLMRQVVTTTTRYPRYTTTPTRSTTSTQRTPSSATGTPSTPPSSRRPRLKEEEPHLQKMSKQPRR